MSARTGAGGLFAGNRFSMRTAGRLFLPSVTLGIIWKPFYDRARTAPAAETRCPD